MNTIVKYDSAYFWSTVLGKMLGCCTDAARGAEVVMYLTTRQYTTLQVTLSEFRRLLMRAIFPESIDNH